MNNQSDISRAAAALGSRKTEAKAKAASENGKKGGRPAHREIEIVEWRVAYSAPGGSLVLREIESRRKEPLAGARTERGWLRRNGYSRYASATWEIVDDRAYLGWFEHDNDIAVRIVEAE